MNQDRLYWLAPDRKSALIYDSKTKPFIFHFNFSQVTPLNTLGFQNNEEALTWVQKSINSNEAFWVESSSEEIESLLGEIPVVGHEDMITVLAKDFYKNITFERIVDLFSLYVFDMENKELIEDCYRQYLIEKMEKREINQPGELNVSRV